MGQATITTSVGVAPSKNLTIDLNGNTLSRSDSNNPIVVNPGIKLILKDSSEAGTGKVTAINNVVFIGNGGAAEFEIQSGTVEATNGVAVMVNGNGSFTMNGGSVSSSASYGVYINNGSFTMDGGSVSSSAYNGVYVNENSSFTMNDGTVTSTASGAVGRYPQTGFTMNGGTITGITTTYPITTYGSSDTLVINDGTITGKLAKTSNDDPDYDLNSYIASGKDKAYYDDNSIYIGSSYTNLVSGKVFGPMIIDGVTRYYSTEEKLDNAITSAGCVASIGNNYYTSLKDAIAAAQSGGTVKLIADTDIGSDKITIDKNITLDLNEKTLTVGENNPYYLEVAKGSTLTVNNGTINPTGSTLRECTIKLQAGANLNMDSVTVTDTHTNEVILGSFIRLATDSDVTTSSGSLIAQNRGTINLTNVNATLTKNTFITSPENGSEIEQGSKYYVSGYEINVNGGSYISNNEKDASSLFQLSGMKANFNGVTINTKTAGCVYLPNRYDLTKGTPTNAESTPNATFEDCTFTIEGPRPSSYQWLSSIISVAEANVAQIKSGKYTLAGSEASSDPYGFYVYSSNGGFIIDGGEFVNETSSQAMFTFSENTVEEFNYLNNNTPSAVVKGGDFTNAGTLTNTAKTSSDTSAAGQLKVTGGSYGSSEQVSDYVPAGSVAEKSSGSTFTIGEDPNNEWKQDETTKTTYHYVLGKTSTLITATGVTAADSVNLNYDSDNKLVFIPNVNYTWDADLASGRSLAKINIADNAVSISPEKGSVIIAGASYIGNVTTLTTTGETDIGITVDATDNKLENITGGTGNDSLKAGERNTTLNGGAGDDTLEGNSGDDLFIYTAGKDEIKNYTYGTDTVSVTSDLTPPVDLDKLSFNNGSDLVIKFDDNGDNRLTFRSAADVALVKGKATYSYQGNSNGMNYVAFNSETKHGISLGAGYSGRFNGTNAANEDYETIDASHVNNAIRVTGNDNNNYMFASKGGGTLEGGEGKDILNGAGTTASLVLNGGDDDDSLIGGTGKNVFFYTGGADSISGYHDNDLITVRGGNIDIANAAFSAEGNNISLDFGGEDRLIFEDISGVTNGVSLQSGRNTYIYTKETIALENKTDKGITLTSGFLADSFAAGTYDTINAVAVGKAISLIGNDNNNVIFGSSLGGGLYGGKGNDKLDISERANDAKFVLKYTDGKDTVSGIAADDKLEITADKIGEISKAKSSKGNTRLAFTFDKSNVLTFTNEDEVNSVSLNGGGFLTKDGVVKGTNFKLFASARGKIDLTEAPYVGAGIASINAADVKKQSVTLIGASVDSGSSYTFAEKNKKKDLFEYNGGNVSISGYESGVDRLDLNTAALTGFSVGGTGGNVSLTTGLGTVVLESMQGNEVLLHHAESKRSSFSKMVFKDTGVILNKEKRPTAATVSGDYDISSDSTASTVKKIFVADGASSIAITAGDRNKTTLDASASNGGVTLTGGAKNDKLIGSTSTVAADTFVYTAGKDIIQNYGSNDTISLGDFASSLTSAKINAGSRSIKFKFSNKNALTIKPAKGSTLGSALNISGIPNYTYAKNAIAQGSNASLTSEFSGSYRLKNSGVNNVDGSRVKKNLTYRGTSADETLSGGTKKTTFKGGGGDDLFTGGSGNDIFFYAKGDSGNATIASFDFTNDKLKIAGGTITKVSTVNGGIKFDMNNGRKNSANIGSFTVANSLGSGAIDTTKTLIKTNNTYYWFAQDEDTSRDIKVGDLITADTKVSKSNATATGYAIIDLGYSSNLVKADVATKAGEFTFDGGITKKPAT